MFTLMIGLSATGIAAGIGVKLVRARQRRQVRNALGITLPSGDTSRSAQNLRALREYAAIDARLRESSPHLAAAQRRELAVNLIRARGLVPQAPEEVH